MNVEGSHAGLRECNLRCHVGSLHEGTLQCRTEDGGAKKRYGGRDEAGWLAVIRIRPKTEMLTGRVSVAWKEGDNENGMSGQGLKRGESWIVLEQQSRN